jgi:hypothetical protein
MGGKLGKRKWVSLKLTHYSLEDHIEINHVRLLA